MAKVNAKTAITTTDSVKSVNQAAKKTVGSILQAMLDSENYRNRFQDLLGKRMP